MSVQTDLAARVAGALAEPCALLARTHGSQLAGTAPVATGWVLVEQPGAWGRTALTSSGLEPALGAHLDDLAGPDVRVGLVRRPGSHTLAVPSPRTVLLAHTGPRPWLERLEVETDAELWELDPAVAAAPTPPGVGVAVETPQWLVCTHGKRDRCCAEHGRPIVDALAAQHGAAVWEVSHIGGHRFAGNVLSLPGGEVYGLLDAQTARAAVTLQLAGRYDVGRLRGHSGRSRPVQAAELLVRRLRDLDAHDAVRPRGPGRALGADTTEVDLDVAGVAHRAVVRTRATGVRYLQSCDADEDVDPGRFELVSLDPLPATRDRPDA